MTHRRARLDLVLGGALLLTLLVGLSSCGRKAPEWMNSAQLRVNVNSPEGFQVTILAPPGHTKEEYQDLCRRTYKTQFDGHRGQLVVFDDARAEEIAADVISRGLKPNNLNPQQRAYVAAHTVAEVTVTGPTSH